MDMKKPMMVVDENRLRGLVSTGYTDHRINTPGERLFRLSESNDSYARGGVDIVNQSVKFLIADVQDLVLRTAPALP